MATERPDGLLDEHLTYLDDLRESGETNMFGARPYLMDEFPSLTKQQASNICGYWMKTFGERHPREVESRPANENMKSTVCPVLVGAKV